jgi:hypothetical protein
VVVGGTKWWKLFGFLEEVRELKKNGFDLGVWVTEWKWGGSRVDVEVKLGCEIIVWLHWFGHSVLVGGLK